MSFLSQLNPQQREAVETTEGPLLILAGAGSGKTRVITYRIAHLIENLGVMPESILAVTFTNKAAAEMAARVEKLAGGLSIARPLISTFHSFCVRALRRNIEALRVPSQVPGQPPSGYTKNFVIYDEADQQQVLRSILKRLGVGVDDKQLTPRAALARISWAKNHMLDPQELYLSSTDPNAERLAHIYQEYSKELKRANALDFDDLLLEAVRVLKACMPVREFYHRRFEYILVDEYQDTNRAQYQLLRLLVGERHNLCAVGDEDQSIYSWRGADVRNILEFEENFPEAKIIRLEQNYRSTQNILRAASAVVANNIRRKGKQLWTSRQGGPKLAYYEAPDGENEALFVADWIARYLRESLERGQNGRAAVLYRINSQSRLFEEAMRRYQLRYNVLGGFSFYERAEIKDLISYLKVVQNPEDSVALLRIVNTPTRGIGKATLETIERVALETGSSLWQAIAASVERALVPPRAIASLSDFRDLIEDARAMHAGTYVERLTETARPRDRVRPAAIVVEPDSPGTEFDPAAFDFTRDEATATVSADDADGSSGEGFRRPGGPASTAEILKFLLERTGYMRALEKEDTPESQSRKENLQELVNAALDSKDRGETLEQFLDHAALISDADAYDEQAPVNLMTLHSAKGLEFPLVFLCGLEEGIFPHSRTFANPDDVEEERRLCYVGMTRAMDQLVLTRAAYRRRYGTDTPELGLASRFLREVPAELVEEFGDSRRSRRRSPVWSSYEDGGRRWQRAGSGADGFEETHYAYEDEDQSVPPSAPAARKHRDSSPAKYNSIDHIAEFFRSRGKNVPELKLPEPKVVRHFRPGQRVRHPKYGEGTVHQREGEGEAAKITVQFPRFGLKKLVEKYAQLDEVRGNR